MVVVHECGTMGTQPGCLCPGPGTQLEHGVRVTGPEGMAGELRRLDGARALGEHGKRSSVQPDTARTGAGFQNGAVRQLVGERDDGVVPPEHALRDTPDHRLEGPGGHPAEDIDVTTRPQDGSCEEHLPRVLRQALDPGPHRVAHRRRQFDPARRHHLGHEERVAAGCGMSATGSMSVPDASWRTADTDSGGRGTDTMDVGGMSPSVVDSGWSGPTSSSRIVTTTRAGS